MERISKMQIIFKFVKCFLAQNVFVRGLVKLYRIKLYIYTAYKKCFSLFFLHIFYV